MNENPLVSILMPCYNMGRFIGETHSSIGRQTYSNWELIAIDDCGTEDGTKESIESFQNQFPNKRIIYNRLNVNSGVSIARNTAANFAIGDLIAFLDPDDLWEDDHLSNAVRALIATPEVDLIYSPVLRFMDNNYRSATLWKIHDWQIQDVYASLSVGCCIQPSAVVMRKKAFYEVGGFSTEKELQHVEDWDLWIKLAKGGKKFQYIKKPTCLYRGHAGQATANKEKSNLLYERLELKHHGFFLRMRGKLISKSFEQSTYVYNRLSGPLNRLLPSLDIFLKKLINYLKF